MHQTMIILYLLFLYTYVIKANDLFDFRLVAYNESSQSIVVYQNGDETFDAITIDEQRNQFIIGAKNAIIRLSMDTLHLLEKLTWESSPSDVHLCRSQIRSINECENYIRVLALRSHDQSLLTCGTNAYQPICTWRRPDSLTTIIPYEDIIPGNGKAPFNSESPSVYTLIDTGELYSATSNEPVSGIHDPLIQRSFSRSKQLRTQQHDSNWLKNPQFVRILNIGSYIYTFFRETALEHLSCGTNVYSRVARVCKYDTGTMKYSDTFRSFSKLRMQCSRRALNEITSFDFNELQSIAFDSSLKLIYAAFNLPKSGLDGSAICIYTVDQLENVFRSPFLTQKSNESYWLPSSVKQDLQKCESSQSNDVSMIPSGPVLRSGVLQPSFDALIFEDIRIGHLLVDQLSDLTVVFVITLDGLWLRKYSILPDRKLCLVEQVDLKPLGISSEHWKVNKAELIAKRGDVLITTSGSVVKIPVARCERFQTSQMCSASMDPYCAWNDYQQRCLFSPTPSKSSYRLLTCPNLNITVDGGWSTWSSWFSCAQETGETCQCRTRSCTQPKPQWNGRQCQGNQVEITQCEAHGGWSPWSPWSTCPRTCGRASRVRTRTCTNPEPRNNGRICIGSDREEESCPEMICSSDTSRLSAWSEWDECSKPCGGGIQRRRRTCLNEYDRCNECLEETRSCNQSACPIQQAMVWSSWMRLRSSDDVLSDELVTETRTQLVCSMSIDRGTLDVKSGQTMYRVCDHDGNNCQERDSLGHWSAWSEWGECYPSCGIAGSTQTRRRTCSDQQCFGKAIDKRDCSFCPAHSRSNWSCWTDWSDCSTCTSTRSHSTKFRTRQCLANSCEGSSREERACPCPSNYPFLDDYRFTFIHLILISLISFLFGCLLILCIYALSNHRLQPTYLSKAPPDYFPESISASSPSPHTATESDAFTTLSNTHASPMKFLSFDSSGTVGNHPLFKEIPSRKLNVYINPREIPPSPPPPTLKRTSMMSSMKTNLDADDL